MNAGLVVLSSHHWPRLLERWWELSRRIPDDATGAHGVAYETPLHDAFNALLMSEVPEESVLEIPRAEWASLYELPQVDIRDPATLSCTYQGRPLRLEPAELPLWLRDGVVPRLALRSLHQRTRVTQRLARATG